MSIDRARLHRRVVANRPAARRADLDSLAWAIGLTVASLLRVDFELDQLLLWGQLLVLPLAAVVHLALGAAFGLYDGRFRPGSFEDAVAVAKTVVVSMPIVFVLDLVLSNPRMIPLSAIPGGAVIGLVLMFGARWLQRLRLERKNRPAGADVERVVVVGAGTAGEQLVVAMLSDPAGHFLPVAILDDDPDKRTLRIKGVPVVGAISDLAEAAEASAATTVLIGIPSAPREVFTKVTAAAGRAGLDVKVVPSVRELLDDEVGLPDIRSVTPADLLGRHEVHTDVDSIADYVSGRRVLVTGAGGSIGSELCRQLARFDPAELVLLDRDESALHAVQLSLTGRALLDSGDVVLCDIRDRAALAVQFARIRPEVVFHAAALKHLPMLEQYPMEGWKTNVLGSSIVLELALEHGVERFVNVSTDKAADPSSVLGWTKRLSERLTASAAERASGVFLSVRFGNVLGSRGSMLDTFVGQIAAGGPVTVTDPDVTRFFMTIAEACELIIQAGAVGRPGEVLVLDMGAPVRIADVAQLLINQSGRAIEVVHTGLRQGEKLHEVLLGVNEVDERPIHPLISHVAVPPLAPEAMVLDGDVAADRDLLIASLAALAARPAPVRSP